MARMNYEKAKNAQLWREAGRKAPFAHALLAPRPKYREDPATDKQIAYLQILLAKAGRPALDKIEGLKMTKSRASALIKELRGD